MPHERKRHLSDMLIHLAKLSPLVGLLGHRQVGKTTLLEEVSDRYLTLDDEDLLLLAKASPKKLIASLNELGTSLDECQLVPELFPALKERVRKDKRRGQFYLSGSVRFTSKRLIRESLTGRIMSAELLPMTLSELDQKTLPDTLLQLLNCKNFLDYRPARLTQLEHDRRMRLIQQYEICGGLPGVCFIRDPKLRANKLIEQLETILTRDLREIHNTSLSLPEIIRFVRELAAGDLLRPRYQEMRRITGITPITQKKLIFALEATFIIRHVPIEGDTSGSAIFFEDHAECLALARDRLDLKRRWAGLVYRNVREQIFYRIGENAEFFQYQTRAGVFVPFAVRTPDSTIGFIPVLGNPERSDLAAAQSFLRSYGNAKVVLVYDGRDDRVIDSRTFLSSAVALLF